jgi:serine/threonine protein kinase
MHYLNVELKIIHRNLKATNVFLNKQGNQIDAFIGDFGCAMHLENDETNLSRAFNIGKLGWMVLFLKFGFVKKKTPT